MYFSTSIIWVFSEDYWKCLALEELPLRIVRSVQAIYESYQNICSENDKHFISEAQILEVVFPKESKTSFPIEIVHKTSLNYCQKEI